MKDPHLFRHPVGIFPPGARWYLAIIATVALLCVAIHLSIQIYAQKQAETLIHQWGEESGIEIGSVRYHLLRNGLILQNIKLKRGTDSLKIKHMFIRANPKLLTGTAPKIGNIEISDFEAVIWNPESRAAWQNDRKLMRIWHATQSLSISGGTLSLQMKDKPHPPLKLNIVSLQQQVQKSVRKIAADFLLAGAPVTWHWSSPDGLQNSSKTSLSWQQVDSRLLTSAMGLNTTEGLLSGKVNWTISDKAKTNGSASIQGEVELNSSTQSTQQLNWSGKLRDGNWALDMQAKAWPVQAWAEALPVIAGRKLQHGLLDTQLHWQRKGGIWKLSTRQGSLKEVIYTNHNRAEEEQHAWKWGRIDFKDLRLNFSSRKLHTASIRTERSSMVFQLQEEGSSAPQQRHINKRHWDISSDKIDIEDMTLGVAMAHGKLLLPALKGRCNWTLDNKIAFNLRSMKQKEAQHTGLQQENHRHAVWRVKGEAEYKYGNINRSTFKLRGKDVELALLRPLIPLQSSPETPLSLGGVAGLNMDITIANGLWQAYGKASINSPVLAYAGDRWKAERVETKFGPVGMGLKTQKIDTLDAENWHYTTALQPLPAYRVTDEESSDTTPAKVSWWINDLRRNNWQADRLSWKNGKVSIGNSDLLWAEALDIEITQLKPEQWAKVNAQGQLGQGYGSLKGSWYALADTQRFRGKATLDNSLPFFLHNWMTASGIPRLIRGRLSAELSIKDGKEENSYNSHVKLTLTRAVTETPPPPADPMIARTGFSTSGLIEQLSNSKKIISLEFDNRGDWDTQPLNLNLLGASLQQAMQRAATTSKKNRLGKKQADTVQPIVDTRIRLRTRGALSLNERTRLRKSLRSLSKKPGWMLELRPKWTGDKIDPETIQRIRYTQKQIERFITQRHFPKAKVYPIWPTPEDHANEVGAIWVTLTPPD